jgi:hypothetical protein
VKQEDESVEYVVAHLKDGGNRIAVEDLTLKLGLSTEEIAELESLGAIAKTEKPAFSLGEFYEVKEPALTILNAAISSGRLVGSRLGTDLIAGIRAELPAGKVE